MGGTAWAFGFGICQKAGEGLHPGLVRTSALRIGWFRVPKKDDSRDKSQFRLFKKLVVGKQEYHSNQPALLPDRQNNFKQEDNLYIKYTFYVH